MTPSRAPLSLGLTADKSGDRYSADVLLRIERLKWRIRLSGEFRIAHLDQVKIETERCESPVVLDLEEVDLIDIEGVRFLNAFEAKGITVLQCSSYIREWMLQEQRTTSGRVTKAGGRKGLKGKKENKNDSEINTD